MREAVSPLVHGCGGGSGLRQNSAVVDEDVDGREVIGNALHGLCYGFDIAGIEAYRIALMFVDQISQIGEQPSEGLLIAVMDDDSETILQEHANRGLSENASGTGDLRIWIARARASKRSSGMPSSSSRT